MTRYNGDYPPSYKWQPTKWRGHRRNNTRSYVDAIERCRLRKELLEDIGDHREAQSY